MGTTWTYRAGKRLLDVIAAGAGLIVLSPVMVAVALAIKVTMGGPVVFSQRRIGRAEREFTVRKFRTMRDGAGADAERLTRFGSALRAASLDELPQLWNVVRGDMSLVGPRPLLPEYLPRYDERQRLRHLVRPGITGLAQISGRNGLDWATRLELDVRYVETRGSRVDLEILRATFATVAASDGIAAPGSATMTEFLGTGSCVTSGSRDGSDASAA